MKFLSSIFSFSFVQLRAPGLLQSSFWIALLLVLGAEMGMRNWIPDGLQPNGSWYNGTIRDQYREFASLRQHDVLIAGSSVASVNIPPVAFDSAAAVHGVSVVSCNAGVAGPDYEAIAAAIRRIYWPERSCNVAILLIAPPDVNHGNMVVRDRTAAYLRAFGRPVYERLLMDVFSKSYLYGFREHVQAWFAGRPAPEMPDVRTRGYTPMGAKQRTRYQWPYAISADSRPARAFLELAGWLAERAKRVIIVRAPMESAEWQRIDAASLRAFEQLLKEADNIHNVSLFDAGELQPAAESFIDQLHLNNDAANTFAAELAEALIAADLLTFAVLRR